MTHEEQACIQNMMQEMDRESNEFMLSIKRFEAIYHPVAEGELLGTVSGIYGLIMGYIGSELGNRGELDKSDWYNETMVREELRSRRLALISVGLYNRWWNYAERKRKNIPCCRLLNGEEELTKCIVLSRLVQQKFYESVYQKKLEHERLI